MSRTRLWDPILVALIAVACEAPAPQARPLSPPEDRFIELNEAKLHYLDWGGEGPLLVFVPGLSNTAYAFTEVAPAFTDRYRVLAITRRGHGVSDAVPDSFDVDLNVDDLAAFISAFSDGPAIVVGMSHGGLEIPRLARRYPDRVRSLVFLDAVYDWRDLATFPPLVGFGLDTLYASYEALDRQHYDQFAEFASGASIRQLHSQVYTRADGQVAWQLPLTGPTMRRYVQMWAEWDPSDYEAITVPVLAIRSMQEGYLVESLSRRGFPETEVEAARSWARDFDDASKTRGLELLAAAVPDARIVELEATHHLLHFHRPREVVEAMDAFLREHEGS